MLLCSCSTCGLSSNTMALITSDCGEVDGRLRIGLFLELPRRKVYPDYYQVISNPTCVAKVRSSATKEMGCPVDKIGLHHLFRSGPAFASAHYKDIISKEMMQH